MNKKTINGLVPIAKKYMDKYFSATIGLFLCAIAFNLFFVPTNIIYGGANGIALTIKAAFYANAQITLAITYVVFLIIGLIFLDKKTVSKAIVVSILYPAFVFLTADITKYILIDYTKDLLLIYTFGAIVIGFGSGLIYKKGLSGGGIDIIRLIFHKYFGISLGKTTILVNSIVVITGAIVTNNYGNVMYAMIILYVISFVTDRVILGISEQKIFQIVTNKEKEIKEFVINQLEHNVTIFNVKGGYSSKKGNILLCVIPTKEYFMMKEAIKEIDKDAFFVVSDAYESTGGK